jgi:hypothetical protein
MRKILAIVVLAAALILPSAISAHPGHDHKLMGTVVSVNGQTVLIKTTDGKERSFQLTAVTKVLNGKLKGDARDIKAGMRVVVNVGDAKEPLKAKEIQYTLADTAKK